MAPTTSDCSCYDALCDWKEPRVSGSCFQKAWTAQLGSSCEGAALLTRPGIGRPITQHACFTQALRT